MGRWPFTNLKRMRRKSSSGDIVLAEINARLSQLVEALGSRAPAPQQMPQLDLIAARLSRLETLAERWSVLNGVDDGLRQLADINAGMARLERLMHGGRAVYAGNHRILTKASLGDETYAYLVEANDRLVVPELVTTGVWEPDVTQFFISTINHTDNCLDIGANFGYYTCIMARRAPLGKTIGIEPDKHVFELLRDNICINWLNEIATPRQAAIGAEPGTLVLHRRVTRSGNTSIVRADYAAALGEPEPEAFEAECIPVDHLLPEFEGRVDCIKVDVEGAEPLVFAGATHTIASNPQIKIVMEWSPGQIQEAGFDLAEFTAQLGNLGFAASVIHMQGVEAISWEALRGQKYFDGVLLTRQ